MYVECIHGSSFRLNTVNGVCIHTYVDIGMYVWMDGYISIEAYTRKYKTVNW